MEDKLTRKRWFVNLHTLITRMKGTLSTVRQNVGRVKRYKGIYIENMRYHFEYINDFEKANNNKNCHSKSVELYKQKA
jgi:hypothetical protein